MSRWRDAQPLATLAVAALSVATVVTMCRIFAEWGFLQPMVVVVLAVHLFAFSLRVARVPTWAALPLSVGVVLPVVAVVYYRDSTAWLLPTGETLDLIRADVRLVWEQFPRAVAPVPSEGSFVICTAMLLGLCAATADTFAFRAFGRAEAVVPTGVVFVFGSALGIDRNRVSSAALWIGAALVAVAMLRLSHGRDDRSWMGGRQRSLVGAVPATVACALVAALGAGAVGPRLPGAGEDPLVDTRNRSNEVTQVLSPLVDIRSRLVNRGNVELFSVESDAPAYWRVAGLTEFDGSAWTPPDEDLRPAVGRLAAVRGDERIISQTIVIERLGGNLVPAAFSPVQLGSSGLFFADSTQTLVLPGDGLQTGDVIRVLSAAPTLSADELRLSTASFPPDPAWARTPRGIPDEAVRLAVEVTAGATTPYDQARMLQDWFRSEFTYDLNVQSGHSGDAMSNFLRIRRGYCEQFAGTFAAMARSLGLPARVAVGFTQGDLGSDGRYRVAGRHAHAWPEVWFDRVGWVSFEPTPGRGEPGAEARTGAQPAQDDSGGVTGPGTNNPEPAPTTTTLPGPVTPTTEPDVGNGSLPSTSVPSEFVLTGPDDDGPGPLTVVALLAAALAAWMVLMPVVVRLRVHHRSGSTADRVAAAWHRACESLQLVGSPPVRGATPLEYARVAEAATGVDHRTIAEIARCVTRVVYAPDTVGEAMAVRCEQLRDEIGERCHERLGLRMLLLSRLDPRIAARVVSGRGDRRGGSARIR